MKVTPERSIRKLPTAEHITASEACSSKASATARSTSPCTTTPSAVLSRSQVGGIGPGTVYTCATAERNGLLARHEGTPGEAEGFLRSRKGKGNLPLRISWCGNHCRCE